MATSRVTMPQQEPDMFEKLIPVAGGLVGSYFGGPAGGAAGGAVGNEAVATGQNQGQAVQTSGLSDQRMQAIQQKIDAANAKPVLERGQELLAQQSPEVQQQLQPVIQEALNRSAAQQEEARQRRLQRTV